MWTRYEDKIGNLLRDYAHYFCPHEVNFDTLNFLASAESIFINHSVRAVSAKGQTLNQKVQAIYGGDGKFPESFLESEVILTNQECAGKILNKIGFTLLDLKYNWSDNCHLNLKRQIKQLLESQSELIFYPSFSVEWVQTIKDIHKFFYLQNIKFPLTYMMTLSNDKEWLLKYVYVGTFRFGYDQEIQFLVTSFGNVLSADFHFSKKMTKENKFNLTTAFHLKMIDWSKQKELRYYGLGITESNSLVQYDGVKRYKEMWGGDSYYQFLKKNE